MPPWVSATRRLKQEFSVESVAGDGGGIRAAMCCTCRVSESGESTDVVDAVVETTLLGGPRRYTRAQVAELSGVSVDNARKLWIALGFPAAASDDEAAFTDA